MTSEIGATRSLPATSSRLPPKVASELAIKLLQPLQGLLEAGQQVNAQVLAQRQEQQTFILLLRVTLSDGRQTNLPAQTSTALPTGTQLVLNAITDQLLSARTLPAREAILTRFGKGMVTPGSILQIRIDAAQSLPQANAGDLLQRLLATIVSGQAAGRQLYLDSPTPLRPGTMITAQAISNQTLRLLSESGAAETLKLYPLLQQQLSQQMPLESVLAPLARLQQQPGIPQNLQTAISQLLAHIPPLHQLQDPEQLVKAILNSGSFLEARLLGGAPATDVQHDLKANLLRLIGQVLPLLPVGLPGNSPPPAINPGLFSSALPQLLQQLLRGTTSRQTTNTFPLGARSAPTTDEGGLMTLLKLAAAAVSRLHSHQLASAAHNQTLTDGSQLSTWQVELPLQLAGKFTTLQLRVEQESKQPHKPRQNAQSIWRFELAFNLDTLGPLQIKGQLLKGCFSSQVWAERASTALMAEQEFPWLAQRIVAAGMSLGELSCHHGHPPQGPRTQLQQGWINEQA